MLGYLLAHTLDWLPRLREYKVIFHVKTQSPTCHLLWRINQSNYITNFFKANSKKPNRYCVKRDCYNNNFAEETHNIQNKDTLMSAYCSKNLRIIFGRSNSGSAWFCDTRTALIFRWSRESSVDSWAIFSYIYKYTKEIKRREDCTYKFYCHTFTKSL